MFEDERKVFELEYFSLDGYLCYGFEMYLIYEFCVMCFMVIFYFCMGKVVFCYCMLLMGGFSVEDRGCGYFLFGGVDGGCGFGLFWCWELNWSLIVWEWELGGCMRFLEVDKVIYV